MSREIANEDKAMSPVDVNTIGIVASDASRRRIEEALNVLREKDVRSATIERLRISWEADEAVRNLPQQIQIGEGLYYLLDHISLPVSPDDLILGRITDEIPDAEGELLLEKTAEQWRRGIPPWMHDGGHECLDWERFIRLGFSGLEDFAKSELDRRIAMDEIGAHLDFLRGAVRIYQSFRNYARCYAKSAREAGLHSSAERCSALTERPPETFAEALQLIWLLGIVYCSMASVNPTLTFGRIDELLLDFYLADIDAGIITRDEAGAMIEDFYCKNNLILGRGEHQMSGGTENDTGWLRNLCYDAPQYIILGGYRRDGSPSTNELTQLFLERIVPRFENPVVVLRYTSDMPDHIWRIACDKMRANSSVLVYNDEDIIPAMIHSGIDKRDAVTYTMHGCNWPDIPAKGRELYTYMAVLPHFFLRALMDGEEPESIDEIYRRFTELFKSELQAHCDRFRERRRNWDKHAPGSLKIDDCFLDNPVANARSWTVGGVEYLTMICSICGTATAVDCFSAVDEVVFSSGKASISELRVALAHDFDGQESLRQLLLNAPKFGQDDDRADRHAVRIIKTLTTEIDRASRLGTPDEIIIFRCLETDMSHIHFGARMGATPDGRHAGKPISENTSPYPGSCIYGLTAMLNSIAKLPLDRICSGALNVRLQPRMIAGDEGLSKLVSLLRTYFDMGGLQIQLSVADTDELREAQINPETHRDLMVRITGYSAVFVDMCKRAQDEIIRRQEME